MNCRRVKWRNNNFSTAGFSFSFFPFPKSFYPQPKIDCLSLQSRTVSRKLQLLPEACGKCNLLTCFVLFLQECKQKKRGGAEGFMGVYWDKQCFHFIMDRLFSKNQAECGHLCSCGSLHHRGRWQPGRKSKKKKIISQPWSQ